MCCVFSRNPILPLCQSQPCIGQKEARRALLTKLSAAQTYWTHICSNALESNFIRQQEHPGSYPTCTNRKNLYVSVVIQPLLLSSINNIQGGVFQQDNTRPHTNVVNEHAVLRRRVFWLARQPDLSPIEHLCNTITRQPQRHPQPILTVSIYTPQLQYSWNYILKTDIRHPHNAMHARVHCCI